MLLKLSLCRITISVISCMWIKIPHTSKINTWRRLYSNTILTLAQFSLQEYYTNDYLRISSCRIKNFHVVNNFAGEQHLILCTYNYSNSINLKPNIIIDDELEIFNSNYSTPERVYPISKNRLSCWNEKNVCSHDQPNLE